MKFPFQAAVLRKAVIFFIFFLVTLSSYSQNDLVIDGVPCSVHGSSPQGSMEYNQNVYKNRNTFQTVSFYDNTITLQGLVITNALESKFSQDKAVKISGYVFNVKPGGVESCNCKTTDEVFRDTHIELTPDNKHTDPEYRMIDEITPRMRQIMEKQETD